MTGIHRLVTSGQFNLDGQTWDVDNNVWLVGDDREVVVVDPAHDAEAVLAEVGDRRVTAILCTHAHDDHVRAAPELGARTGAPVLLHPDDDVLWKLAHPDRRPDRPLDHGQTLDVGGHRIEVLHTPGHAPGAVCFHLPEAGVVLSGDTLFQGGPGATGRSYSDFPTIVESIRDRLLSLPEDTVVHSGHGADTRIGAEAPSLDEWVSRGR